MSAITARRRALLPSSPAAYNPLTALPWSKGVWADDPSWSNPGNGNAVSSWRNGGSISGNLLQSTSTMQPIFRASVAALNGKAAVDFDGVDDYLASATFSMAQPFTVVWVGKLDDAPGADERLVDLKGSDSGHYTSLLINSGKFAIYAAGYGVSTVNATSGLAAADRSYFDGASSAVNVNGTNTNVSVATNNSTRFSLAAFYDNGSYFGHSNNHTAFVGFISGNITTAAGWADFVAWVSSFYGLTIA